MNGSGDASRLMQSITSTATTNFMQPTSFLPRIPSQLSPEAPSFIPANTAEIQALRQELQRTKATLSAIQAAHGDREGAVAQLTAQLTHAKNKIQVILGPYIRYVIYIIEIYPKCSCGSVFVGGLHANVKLNFYIYTSLLFLSIFSY